MNVVNFGSLNIDHVYAVDHFCRAGETIHTAGYTQNAGGKGLNQSIAVGAQRPNTLPRRHARRGAGEPLAQLLGGLRRRSCGISAAPRPRRATPSSRSARRSRTDLPLRRLQPGRHAGGHRRRALALCPGRLSADAERAFELHLPAARGGRPRAARGAQRFSHLRGGTGGRSDRRRLARGQRGSNAPRSRAAPRRRRAMPRCGRAIPGSAFC